MSNHWLVDGHVHLHPCYDLEALLASNERRRRDNARRLGLADDTPAAWLLTEMPGVDRFTELATGTLPSGWHAETTQDDEAIWLTPAEGPALLVVAGAQHVTAEGIEVLALGTRARLDEGMPLDATITGVMESGALACLPWGVGKWLGGRGKKIAAAIEASWPAPLFLGDNAGRPQLSLPPPLLNKGRERGLSILPGTDPLPFESETTRPLAHGFVLEATLDADRPAQALKTTLTAGEGGLQPFGRRESVIRFFRHQVEMQLRKRRRSA
ncbi:MAG: hypothetical protein AAF533_06810 [Acidobacteriota bacterium]